MHSCVRGTPLPSLFPGVSFPLCLADPHPSPPPTPPRTVCCRKQHPQRAAAPFNQLLLLLLLYSGLMVTECQHEAASAASLPGNDVFPRNYFSTFPQPIECAFSCSYAGKQLLHRSDLPAVRFALLDRLSRRRVYFLSELCVSSQLLFRCY